MIAKLAPLPPAEPLRRLAHGRALAARPAVVPRALLTWIAGATAFFCMLPYPAYAVGGATAVQAGNICAALACLPLLIGALGRPRQVHLYAVLVAPLLVAALAVAVSNSDHATLAFKSLAVWAASLLGLVVAQLYAPRCAVALLTGIAAATLLHAGVGLWQSYAFSHDHFPLVELYVNPSFLSVQENADTIARWTKRPFGLFPEPSAMSSSLSPWVLIWAGILTGVLRLKQHVTGAHRLLFAAAAAGGMALIILSRSGQTAVTMLGLLIIAALWLLRARATQATLMAVVAASGAVLPAVLWFAARAVADRIGGTNRLGNSSWEERASSIVLGFSIYAAGGLKTLLFGLGPGLASLSVWEAARLEAVWSVSLSYLYDTGVVGVLAASWLAAVLLRNWLLARFDLAYAGIGFVWLVGVTLTTSYEQLLPLWLALGVLTVWPDVFEPAAALRRQTAPAQSYHASRPVAADARPRKSPWRPSSAVGEDAVSSAAPASSTTEGISQCR